MFTFIGRFQLDKIIYYTERVELKLVWSFNLFIIETANHINTYFAILLQLVLEPALIFSETSRMLIPTPTVLGNVFSLISCFIQQSLSFIKLKGLSNKA